MNAVVLPLIEKRFSSMHNVIVTYTARVDYNRTVEMSGDQADLDKILVAMRMMREDYTVSEFVSDWQEWINRHDGDTVEALRVALFQRDTAYEEVKQMLHAQWDAEYVLGIEEHGVVGSLDLLNLLSPVTAGAAINEALRKLWPDRPEEREDVFDLARQVLAGYDEVDRREFFRAFSIDRSSDRTYALAVVRRLSNIIYDLEPK